MSARPGPRGVEAPNPDGLYAHGTSSAFVGLGCRCTPCVDARNAYLRTRRQRLLDERVLDEDGQLVTLQPVEHGTRHVYNTYGCRCSPCRDAAAEHRTRQRKTPSWVGR